MSDRRGDWIQTVTGKRVYPLDPREDEIDILDITHALSHLCRFGGHSSQFYSVAQHSVLVSDLLAKRTPQGVPMGSPSLRLWGLLHDASEAYLGDVVHPLKRDPIMGEYRRAEDRMMEVIARKFGLAFPPPEEVKAADLLLLAHEARTFMGPWDWARLPEIQGEPLRIHSWASGTARQLFFDRFMELKELLPEHPP